MHIEEDLPFTKKGDKELSAVGRVRGHAHLTKSAQCPRDETLQGKYMSIYSDLSDKFIIQFRVEMDQ